MHEEIDTSKKAIIINAVRGSFLGLIAGIFNPSIRYYQHLNAPEQFPIGGAQTIAFQDCTKQTNETFQITGEFVPLGDNEDPLTISFNIAHKNGDNVGQEIVQASYMNCVENHVQTARDDWELAVKNELSTVELAFTAAAPFVILAATALIACKQLKARMERRQHNPRGPI